MAQCHAECAYSCRHGLGLAVLGGGGLARSEACSARKNGRYQIGFIFALRKNKISAMSMFSVVRKQLRSHPALIPLFIFIGGGATMSMLYLSRLALKNPDVSWDRKNNPEPWNKLTPNQQYKLFAVNMDYSKLEKDRPDF
ncbi:hypothetical protein WMY93_010903 [Mugilogobius chulae]|uniref:Cytochrome c oxidase subunit NDUFA4 n=1 Tax=Mugilogobius chulae TaxID=88201 RepID=A0AAW0PCK1_9GOBI